MSKIKPELQKLIEQSVNPKLFEELYLLIADVIKEEGTVFSTNSGKEMIGFKYIDYVNSSYNGKWPIVAIASQKHTINVYILAYVEEQYVVEKYGDVFGKSNIGKSCIRIKKMTPERKQGLIKMLSLT